MKQGRFSPARRGRTGGSVIFCALLLSACGDASVTVSEDTPPASFQVEIIDPQGPNAPWGKTVGDINGDGLPDIVIGGHRPRHPGLGERLLRKLGMDITADRAGELVWYENPGWKKHRITERFSIRTDLEVADINGDGRNDIVAVTDQGLIWLENGDWEAHLIDPARYHDVEVADLDGDGQPELVVRNQSLFGYDNGDEVRIFQQSADGSWRSAGLTVPHGEGLALADLNRDRALDIVVNGVWLANPGADILTRPWQARDYTRGADGTLQWQWQDVFIDTADLNGDGYPDILLSPAEEAGMYYDIAWLINPGATGSGWRRQRVAEVVEAVHHFVAAADADGDGDLDVLTAEMNQGEGRNPVSVYWNEGKGVWRQEVLSEDGGHSLRAVDIDGDFDIDLVGTNWERKDYRGDYPVWIWRNQSAPASSWQRHVIDGERPGQATAILAADLDGDGFDDLVSGGWWYRNPHRPDGQWQRHALGAGATDAIAVSDVDNDGDVDILATGWYGYHSRQGLRAWALAFLSGRPRHPGNYGHRIFLAENTGAGQFRTQLIAESEEGDLTQGVAELPGTSGRTWLLSWHREQTSLLALHLTITPEGPQWRTEPFSPYSQSEDLSIADLDRDGHPDVVLGTRWLRHTGGDWQLEVIDPGDGKPDRNGSADLDGDGWIDVVVGFEAVSRPGELVWYRNPAGAGTWQKQVIAGLTGPMSLDLADLDGDSDPDLVVGEHNLKNPDAARLAWFENLGSGRAWRGHLIHRGDEHHDGALLVDLDRDGDLDVASIGWGHRRVLVYENPGVMKGRTHPAGHPASAPAE